MHIGCNISIPLKNIIVIYDIKNNENNEFIAAMRDKHKVVDVSQSSPKSCIVTEKNIYLSSISSITLYNRSFINEFSKENGDFS